MQSFLETLLFHAINIANQDSSYIIMHFTFFITLSSSLREFYYYKDNSCNNSFYVRTKLITFIELFNIN